MEPIESLKLQIEQKFPEVKAKIDEPLHKDIGVWYLDLSFMDYNISVVWWKSHPENGFGINTQDSEALFGEVGADEIRPDMDQTIQRVLEIFQEKTGQKIS